MAKRALREDDPALTAADETERVAGAPLPRERANFVGHAETLKTLCGNLASGRMPHGLILAGPRGIGKATLAYRLARYLFKYGFTARGPEDFAVAADDKVFHYVAAGAHPDLLIVRRAWDFKAKKVKSELSVDEARKLPGFFSQHAAMDGARVAIVDSADDMNRFAANALLKALEEPPTRTIVILTSHSPGGLLPTIRSRCRVLTMHPLSGGEVEAGLMELAPDAPAKDKSRALALAEGSLGLALELLDAKVLELHEQFVALMARWPDVDARALHKMAQGAAAAGDSGFARFADLALAELSRGVRAAAKGEGGKAALSASMNRLGPERASALHEHLRGAFREADYANLDKRQAIVSALINARR